MPIFIVCCNIIPSWDRITNTNKVNASPTATTTKAYSYTPDYYSKSDKPYVGMIESEIEKSGLGYHSEVEKCFDFDKMRPDHKYKKYIWKRNGTKVFVATVSYWKDNRQSLGYVSSVQDYTSEVNTYKTGSNTTSTHKCKSSSSSSKGPSTNGYYHAEDFYDDYYDDFFDYYDAEDYYYKHGGK